MRHSMEALMEMVLNNDALAFEALYTELQPSLLSFFRARVNDAFEAEDLVQMTMMKLWVSRDRYRKELGQVAQWARTIAANVLIDHLRRQNRACRRSPRRMRNVLDSEPTIEPRDYLLLGELQREVRAAVEDLPDLLREVCSDQLKEMSVTETSRQRGYRRGTIHGRLAKSRRLLKDDPVLIELVSD